MAQKTDMIGRKLGNYYILAELGKGGMGIVYTAKDMTLDRTVAIKFLPDHVASDEDAVKRFVREARSAARLNHPNIVTIYQVGKAEDAYFIAMEYVEGQPLDAVIRKHGKLDVYKSAELILQVAEALAEAHGQGIIHRDIKPQNIMVAKSGRAKVMDFGLARSAMENTQLTAAGHTMGTPQYMSPEQWKDSKVDGRADIFSLGVTLYGMVTGTPAFAGSTPAAVMQKVLMEEPPAATNLNPSISPQLSDIIEKMMAKKVDERFQSANDVVAALKNFLATKQTQAQSSAEGFSPPGVDLMLEKLSRSDAQFRASGASLPGSGSSAATVPSQRTAPIAPVPAVPDSGSRRTLYIAAAAVVALLLVGVGAWTLMGGGGMIAGVIPASDFVWIEPGTFEMGSPPTENGRNADESLHQVTITKGFYMSKHEVTQKQWTAVMGTNPSLFKGDDLPVENVTWFEAQEFIQKLNVQGGTFRLPTEAEWEYAARAGSRSAYYFGEAAALLGDYGWYAGNSGGQPQPVGVKRPNAWGLHDVSGNVWEWCSDWAAIYPVGNSMDPAGPPTGEVKIGRGGSWGVPEAMCRAADRSGLAPDQKGGDLGFRLVYE